MVILGVRGVSEGEVFLRDSVGLQRGDVTEADILTKIIYGFQLKMEKNPVG